MAATSQVREIHLTHLSVSVPYSSGQWLHPEKKQQIFEIIDVSVPYSSGQWLQPF